MALGLSKNYRSLHEDHKDRMGKMERDFSNDMRLRAAEKFWAKNDRLNRRRAETAFKKLCWVGRVWAALLQGSSIGGCIR